MMKNCNSVILYRDSNNVVGISFTDNLNNRLKKFNSVSFLRFEPISLGSEMSKLQALKYLKTLDIYNDQYFKPFIDEKIGKYLNRLDASNVTTILSNTNIDVKV